MRRVFALILSALGLTSTQATEFPPNSEMNKKTIAALIEAGSNPNKPHPLEHHFYCTNEASLRNLMAKGKSLGYRIANIGDNVHEGVHYWYGDLIMETVLEINKVNQENSKMVKLASEFNADYDGWGTPIVE